MEVILNGLSNYDWEIIVSNFKSLSRNPFSEDYVAVSSICLGLKSQKNLYHFSLTVNTTDPKKADFSLSEIPAKLLQVISYFSSLKQLDNAYFEIHGLN